MQIPLSWLKEYVDLTLSTEELANTLTIAGLEVEHIDYIGIPGGTDKNRLIWDREKLILGHILQVTQHPDADKLVLADVEYGADAPKQVVTGAPNLFPYIGQGDISHLNLHSPLALEGVYLYDGHKEGQKKVKLKGRKVRGIFNNAMLCSEKELGLSEEHDGILILSGNYTPGTPLQDIIGDAVYHIDIIPNIARCASIVGVAREVSALTGQKLHLPNYEVTQEGASIEGKVTISTDDPQLNPRFTAMLIEGVEQKPSPWWMQNRLRLAGQRPLNVVVDISNYVMLEMGQPNHTFDYDFLRDRANSYAGADQPIHIHTRLPHEGETLTTLDGVEHTLPAHTILVTDPAGSLSLGGIMGGATSEINDNTTNVLLEAAAWNFINIRQSSHALRLNSEASFRFSRGVHPSQALLGAKRAAHLLQTLAGGTVSQGIIDHYPNPPQTPTIPLTANEVARLGGIHPSQAEIKTMLQSLEFEVSDQGDHLLVTPPDHRLDIEGRHDVIEEVCRVYGFDNIPETLLEDRLPPQRQGDTDLPYEQAIKDLLVQLGLQEIITYRLTTPAKEARLLPNAPADDRPYVTLANPPTVGRAAMRHSLLASALEIVAQNSRFTDHITLFELSKIYLGGEEGLLPDELRRLAIVMMGLRDKGYWQDDSAPAGLDFYDLKGIIEDLLHGLHISDWQVTAGDHPTFRPGRTAKLMFNKTQVGYFGELHPLVTQAFDIRTDHPVLAAELDVDALLNAIPERVEVSPIGEFPPVREDLALLVDKHLPSADVSAVITQVGGFLLKQVELFDVYEGDQIPAGKKSLAYHLTFQSPSKTLNDRDIKKQRARLLKQLDQRLNAKLR